MTQCYSSKVWTDALLQKSMKQKEIGASPPLLNAEMRLLVL